MYDEQTARYNYNRAISDWPGFRADIRSYATHQRFALK
jgi:hypothetical protein